MEKSENSEILSVCIATYNRSRDVCELVNMILRSEGRFLIEITDNASTDDTVEKLLKIKDERLIIHVNKENIGGVNNMIRSVYNCRSKYALYLNDREIFDAQNLTSLIQYLEGHDIGCGFVRAQNQICSDEIGEHRKYSKGIEALRHINFTEHPSGFIYNMDLARASNLDISYYYYYYGPFYKYVMLACDLIKLGKFVCFNLPMWKEREKEYKKLHVSGATKECNKNPSRIYFHWKQHLLDMHFTIEHIVGHPVVFCEMAEDERMDLILHIADQFFSIMYTYKNCMFMKSECMHYQLRRKFVTTAENISVYKRAHDIIKFELEINRLSEGRLKEWDKKKARHIMMAIRDSLKCDITMVFTLERRRKIKQFFSFAGGGKEN